MGKARKAWVRNLRRGMGKQTENGRKQKMGRRKQTRIWKTKEERGRK